jgi:HSP20 family protein
MADKEEKRSERADETAPSGFLKGITDLVEKLNELAETGRELRHTGEINSPDERLKGIYGFNVRMGIGGNPVQVRPFGNLKVDRRTKQPIVDEVREPLVDVLEESNRILVIAEMPGVAAEDVSVKIKGNIMDIEAHSGSKKYRKEVQLPGAVDTKASISCKNGIVQIECNRD